MKAKYTPAMAVLVILAMSLAFLPGLAQLPPTNMGKYVHQPGDNQYSNQTQSSRHSMGMQQQVSPVSRPVVSYTPAPAVHKPDPTLEPIAAEEPIPQPGFPPLPERLDLPVGGGGSSWMPSAGGMGGGYGGGGGGPAPGMGGGGGGPRASYHQHYGSVPPGAYLQQQGGGSGYRARSPGSDYYNVNTGGGAPGMAAPPPYSGASASDIKALGREPKMNERQEQTQAPDAPTPVVVSQSATQDLSLPEDEFSYKSSGRRSQAGRTLKRMIKAPLNSVGGIAGVRF